VAACYEARRKVDENANGIEEKGAKKGKVRLRLTMIIIYLFFEWEEMPERHK